MRWYVVRTKPRQERMADFHLRQLSVETFLPLLKHQTTIRRQEQTRIEPLFPRYLFARFELAHHYRAVHFSRGVVQIVEFGLEPAEVSEALIDGIKSRMVAGCIIPVSERCQQGQIVNITGGPLSGLKAIFIKELKEQHRVMLLFRALGFSARLTMDRDCLSLPQAL
jgi:transcriptional antiterminator RfaH